MVCLRAIGRCCSRCVGSHSATVCDGTSSLLEMTEITPIPGISPISHGPSIETVTPPGHDVSMTQLFDTNSYEDIDDPAGLAETAATTDAARHLRSIPVGDDLPLLSTQWRLDDRTIEVGRKGIQAARQALQEAARIDTASKQARKAA
jgi:hypothetical protein